MIGVRNRRIDSHRVVRSCFSIVTGVADTNVSLMSAPAANARSLPVMTMQRIVSSSSRRASSVTSSSSTCSLSAFSTSGRLIWTVAIGSSRVTMTVVGMVTSPRECAAFDKAAQVGERARQRRHLVTGGATARVRQDPHRRARDPLVLKPAARARAPEGGTVRAHPDEGDDPGAVLADLALDAFRAALELVDRELVGARRRSVHEVRYPDLLSEERVPFEGREHPVGE